MNGGVTRLPGTDPDGDERTWPTCLDCGDLVERIDYVEDLVIGRRDRQGEACERSTLAVMRPCGDTWVIRRLF